jgi:NAD+ synthase (glutamine-hydrolysing)
MLRIALGQFNASVGDIEGNLSSIHSFYDEAVKLGVDLLVFPEMCICGYPPEDLLHKKHFLDDNQAAVERLAGKCNEMTVVVGFAEPDGEQSYNSLAVLADGEIKNIYRKGILPNYGVFDEQRYFKSGKEPLNLKINDISVVFTVCEDVWELKWLSEFLGQDMAKDLIVNISASPFHLGKMNKRQQALSHCARHFNSAIAYCNLVGGQDELVFDGRSMLVDQSGKIIAHGKEFEEDMLLADLKLVDGQVQFENVKAAVDHPDIELIEPIVEVYRSLVLGTRDYVRKNGFEKVLIGLSGGIDSAVTAAIAVDAMGAENVVGITLPSKFNSPETINDAEKMAKTMKIDFLRVPIAEILYKFNEDLGTVAGWDDKGVAFENLQARIRGCILMSLSNQFSYLVLTTGNKSETAVGYSTLYGDTAGGFAVIKDVPKTMVYELARYINKIHEKEFVPESVIERPPSAELREDQKDTDSLPDYDLLDKILKGYVEDDKSVKTLIEDGLPADIVKRIVRLVDLNEYKRRQSPPGVRITPKAFGKDRRMPITNRYK